MDAESPPAALAVKGDEESDHDNDRPHPGGCQRHSGRVMKPVDPRLLRHARASRGYLVVAVVLGVVVTGMVVAQAELLARLLAGAARGTRPAVVSSALIALLAVVTVRAAAAYGGQVAALRAAAAVKS